MRLASTCLQLSPFGDNLLCFGQCFKNLLSVLQSWLRALYVGSACRVLANKACCSPLLGCGLPAQGYGTCKPYGAAPGRQQGVLQRRTPTERAPQGSRYALAAWRRQLA